MIEISKIFDVDLNEEFDLYINKNSDNDDCNNNYENDYYDQFDEVCNICGIPLEYIIETYEVFGRMDSCKEYYCPICDK